MIIHKFTAFVDYNQWLKRLDTQINKAKKNSIKVTKVVMTLNKKRYNKTLGTSVVNSPMSPPFHRSLGFINLNFAAVRLNWLRLMGALTAAGLG